MPAPLDNPDQRRLVADELVTALVELHDVDWTVLGLDGFGKPTGYLERQLRRFNGLWEHNKTREIPEFEEVGAWLAANMPASPPATIVHGDYRLGNTMIGHGAPARLIAIFDWEMATIGDPLADVGYMMMNWTEAGDPQNAKFNLQRVTAQPGFPDAPRAGCALRAALGPRRRGARLVRRVGVLEGGCIHGGQLQARDLGLDR